jgi:hypothetical protein
MAEIDAIALSVSVRLAGFGIECRQRNLGFGPNPYDAGVVVHFG